MRLLHVPRTGGTAIKASLIDGYKRHPKRQKHLETKVKNLYVCNHSQKLDMVDKYIFFVRDPIDRFVSHFVFLKKHAKGYDTYKIMNPSKDKVLSQYENINDFARDVFKLRLNKFIKFSDILVSPKHIKKHLNNIAYVGRTEYLDVDFVDMQDKLNLFPRVDLNKDYTNKRPSKYDDMIKLDEADRYNLRIYLDKDYEIIKALIKYGLIHKSYLNIIKFRVPGKI